MSCLLNNTDKNAYLLLMRVVEKNLHCRLSLRKCYIMLSLILFSISPIFISPTGMRSYSISLQSVLLVLSSRQLAQRCLLFWHEQSLTFKTSSSFGLMPRKQQPLKVKLIRSHCALEEKGNLCKQNKVLFCIVLLINNNATVFKCTDTFLYTLQGRHLCGLHIS